MRQIHGCSPPVSTYHRTTSFTDSIDFIEDDYVQATVGSELRERRLLIRTVLI